MVCDLEGVSLLEVFSFSKCEGKANDDKVVLKVVNCNLKSETLSDRKLSLSLPSLSVVSIYKEENRNSGKLVTGS